MTHITKNLNDAILQALYDTGHRFNSNWRQIIMDIVEEFGAIGSMRSTLVVEDLRGFHFEDFGFSDTSHGLSLGIHKPMTRELLATIELSDVNTPWADEVIVIGERWGKVGPKAAWFLERIRELNFTGTEYHREFSYRGGGHDDDGHWWWMRCGVAGGIARLSGCLEEITWSVLIKYISFIREMSNWTMPLMPIHIQSASRDCVNHWQRLMNGEVSGMGEGHVYECFNQEQGERLPVAWNRIAYFPRRENVVSQGGAVSESGGGENKKKMIHEILEILEDKVGKSELGEGAYKGYSELLMELYKSI